MGASIDALDPGLRDAARALDAAVRNAGFQGRFTSTVRTYAEQNRLYRRFLAGQSQFPAVPPGASTHEYGLAFDYVVEPFSVQSSVGQLWSSWGGGWSPTDAVHFELPGASGAVYKAYNDALEASVGQDTSILRTAILWLAENIGPGPWWSTFIGVPSYPQLLRDVTKIPPRVKDRILSLYYSLVYEQVP